MINRLIAYLDQIKKVSSNRMYFNKGRLFSVKNNENVFQCFCDCTLDKKGKEFFADKTFYIDYDKFKEFIDSYKKNYSGISFNGKTIQINTSIPDVSLEFNWTEENDIELKKTKLFFKDLTENYKRGYVKYTLTEISKEFIESQKLYCADRIYTSFETEPKKNKLTLNFFPKKNFGKLLSSTKEVSLAAFKTDDKDTFIIKVKINNSNLVSTYYGIMINS